MSNENEAVCLQCTCSSLSLASLCVSVRAERADRAAAAAELKFFGEGGGEKRQDALDGEARKGVESPPKTHTHTNATAGKA